MLTALHYTSVRPPVAGDKQVFGLHVAVTDLIRAVLRYARAETIPFLIAERQEADELQALAREAGADVRRLALLDRRFEQNYAALGAIFRAEPDTRGLLTQRQVAGNYSFCGLAHAISGVEAGAALQDYCLSPSEVGDAIICPSRAVAGAIRAFWDHYADYLRARFGAAYRCPVELPVIPLGVDLDKFATRATPERRADQRRKLGVAEDEIVLLWVGRLSAAIKAHPLAMFRAAEGAARQSGAKVRLVMQGYFVPAEAEEPFRALAASVCAQAKVEFIAADDPRFPDGLWAAGDIFLSLIDNMQESFGLTPIEAAAAGLPRVLSDWDGYRDSVTDGEDGFLIRTTQPPPGCGYELTAQVALGREVYGGFLAKAALTVAVDAEQAAERLARLIADPALRRRMGARALARARATYDWRAIVPAYEDLWAELAARRAAASPVRPTSASALPLLPDPYAMYAGYATAPLGEGERVQLVASLEEIRQLWQNPLNSYGNDVMLPAAEVGALLDMLARRGALALGEVFAAFPAYDKPRLWRTLGWFLKLGLLKKA